MRKLFSLIVLLGFGALLAIATRPGPEAFDRMLRARLAEKVATTDIDAEGDAVATLALIGCKLRPSDCFDTVRALLDVRFEEGLFLTRAEVRGLAEASCTGAFTRFWCSKDVLDN